MGLKLTVYQISRRIVCPDGPLQPAIRIRFANGVEELVFSHEPPDLFGIHPNSDARQPHIGAPNAFVVTAEPVSVQDSLQIHLVPLLPNSLRFQPAIISGPGNSGHIAQLGHCEDILGLRYKRDKKEVTQAEEAPIVVFADSQKRGLDMSHYRHLSIEEREKLYLMRGQGKTIREIGRGGVRKHQGPGGSCCLYDPAVYQGVYARAQPLSGGQQRHLCPLPDERARRYSLYRQLCRKARAGNHQYSSKIFRETRAMTRKLQQ